MLEFLKKLFGQKAEARPPAARISMAPGQSVEEQDSTRQRMESEMDASRAARDVKKTES